MYRTRPLVSNISETEQIFHYTNGEFSLIVGCFHSESYLLIDLNSNRMCFLSFSLEIPFLSILPSVLLLNIGLPLCLSPSLIQYPLSPTCLYSYILTFLSDFFLPLLDCSVQCTYFPTCLSSALNSTVHPSFPASSLPPYLGVSCFQSTFSPLKQPFFFSFNL
jgi:hypothetical protein